MIHVSEIYTTAPEAFSTPLQERAYAALAALDIPFQRVATDEVITMADCEAVNARLDMQMVKTLFLCDRKQSEFYLFITAGSKPFRAKDFSAAMDVARLSFAPVERMHDMLGTDIGAATVFSALLDTARAVHIVFDRDVADSEYYGCSDGTTTGYLKLRTQDVLHRLLPHTGHEYRIVAV